MNELAWILATNPDANVRKPHEAVQLAERAAAITQHRDPRVLDTLAAAYASRGQFRRAIKAAQRAIQLADSAQMRERSNSIEFRLKLYQQGKDYRER